MGNNLSNNRNRSDNSNNHSNYNNSKNKRNSSNSRNKRNSSNSSNSNSSNNSSNNSNSNRSNSNSYSNSRNSNSFKSSSSNNSNQHLQPHAPTATFCHIQLLQCGEVRNAYQQTLLPHQPPAGVLPPPPRLPPRPPYRHKYRPKIIQFLKRSQRNPNPDTNRNKRTKHQRTVHQSCHICQQVYHTLQQIKSMN